jgi:hypothetical protein
MVTKMTYKWRIYRSNDSSDKIWGLIIRPRSWHGFNSLTCKHHMSSLKSRCKKKILAPAF